MPGGRAKPSVTVYPDNPEWIANGLTHLKIKLNGDDRNWDLNRAIRVHEAAVKAAKTAVYSLDFNEKCPNVAYLIDFLHDLKARSAEAYSRIQYIEQPTARDLKANPQNVVHEAAKLVPVVIDESLVSKEAFLLALEMGYPARRSRRAKGRQNRC
jgi:L-alanine-DL-glutamate epimerase-like enolase superfamily enzyme